MKPKHQRFVFILISMVLFCVSVLFIMRAFNENLVFFYTPSDLARKPVANDSFIRAGGLVKIGSLQQDNAQSHFLITDGTAEIEVHYQGALPALFRENQGVIAEGKWHEGHYLNATRILAKHDEKYMPKEVVDALKKSGRWQEGAQ